MSSNARDKTHGRLPCMLCLVVLVLCISALPRTGSIAYADAGRSRLALAPPTPFPGDRTDLLLTNPASSQPVGRSLGSFGTTAAAAVLDTVYVPANGNQTSTHISLAAGQTYVLQITGSFIWGGCDPSACPGGGPDYIRWADAYFMSDDHFHHQYRNFVYLSIDGSLPSLPVYNRDHVYRIELIGTGAPVTLRIEDCSVCYPDNSGSLRVEVLEPNQPAPLHMGVKPFGQFSMNGGPGWGGDAYGNLSLPPGNTVCQWGCFMTSWAMMLDHYGFDYSKHTNPRVLNDWLQQHGGYQDLYVVPSKVVEFANQSWDALPVSLLPARVHGRDDAKLHDLLAAGIPVILKVAPPGGGSHFVLAVGETTRAGVPTWYIQDPGGCGVNQYTYPLTTLAERYSNQYSRMNWAGTIEGPVQLASITLVLASPAHLLLTDPEGRRTGFDPRTGLSYAEILDSAYTEDQLADDGTPRSVDTHSIKMLSLWAPVNGDYLVEVIGIDSGAYELLGVGYDEAGGSTSAAMSGQTEPGQVDVIEVRYSPTPGEGLRFRWKVFLPLAVK